MSIQQNISMAKQGVLLLALTLALAIGQKTEAQQLPMFSQYLFNGFLVNPAYAGLDGLSAVTLTAREQWLGLPNSPKTHIVSFQTRILKNSFVKKGASARRKMMSRHTSGRVGIGGYVFNDKNGIIDRTGAQLTYAYHIPMAHNVMSFAMSASMYQFSIKRQDVKLANDMDDLIYQTSLTMFVPDLGVGAVYTTETYYFGLSISNLTQSYAKLGNNIDNQFRTYRHYNATMGYRYEIDRYKAFEPSVLIKSTDQFSTQVDITAKMYMNDYWGGISFRTGSAFVLMGGVKVDKFSFGYAFDYNLSAIRNHSFGSHEIMVAYKFGNTASRMRWLNR